MDRWLKRKSNVTSAEGEPAPKKTPQEKLTAGSSAEASDVGSDPKPLDSHTGSAGNFMKPSKDKFQANWLKIYPWLEHNNGEMNCSICKMYGAVPFTSRCYKTSTLRRHSDGVSHTAAVKRKHKADSAKNVMAKAIEEAQSQCDEETKGLLKTA
ncbi:hypothetical protein ATANTOWER_029118 [Ataeniobius toweri]|uniref:BED-type domain-containing protein n=1 Tax=Ataeniobius toweri TaxID=208326 RepID=A0ABU7A9A8_9TELE|nr:hypothetical protein [Ataeniobius toweri]